MSRFFARPRARVRACVCIGVFPKLTCFRRFGERLVAQRRNISAIEHLFPREINAKLGTIRALNIGIAPRGRRRQREVTASFRRRACKCLRALVESQDVASLFCQGQHPLLEAQMAAFERLGASKQVEQVDVLALAGI